MSIYYSQVQLYGTSLFAWSAICSGNSTNTIDIVCMLSGGFVLNLKEQADFNERVKEQLHVKTLPSDMASLPLKSTIHLPWSVLLNG